jgi:hexosaminidase
MRLLEQMGRYKLNALHLSLTNDEGWRLQVPREPCPNPKEIPLESL